MVDNGGQAGQSGREGVPQDEAATSEATEDTEAKSTDADERVHKEGRNEGRATWSHKGQWKTLEEGDPRWWETGRRSTSDGAGSRKRSDRNKHGRCAQGTVSDRRSEWSGVR